MLLKFRLDEIEGEGEGEGDKKKKKKKDMLCLFQTQKYAGGGYLYSKLVGVVYGRLLRGENTKKDYSPIGSVIPYLLFKAVQSNLLSPHSKYVKEVFLLRSKLLS